MKVSYKKTLLKTFIWRVVATVITIFSGRVVSGNFKVGIAVGSIDFLLKSVGYFGFERIWIKYTE